LKTHDKGYSNAEQNLTFVRIFYKYSKKEFLDKNSTKLSILNSGRHLNNSPNNPTHHLHISRTTPTEVLNTCMCERYVMYICAHSYQLND